VRDADEQVGPSPSEMTAAAAPEDWTREADRMAAGEVRDALDHPIFFVVVLTVCVMCFSAIVAWALKAAGLPGPANIFGG
jgi:hypothetical protein